MNRSDESRDAFGAEFLQEMESPLCHGAGPGPVYPIKWPRPLLTE